MLGLGQMLIGKSGPTPMWIGLGDSANGYSLATSMDAINWTQVQIPNLTRVTGLAYGKGLWVAVGAATYFPIVTSPDRITWTPRGDVYGQNGFIAYNGSMFVYVEKGSWVNIRYSTDGINWSSLACPIYNPTGVYVVGTTFVITGGGWGMASIAKSPDGITWTTQNVSYYPTWEIVWNGSLYVMASTAPSIIVYTSPDLVTWTSRPTTIGYSNSTFGICWNGSIFVAATYSSGADNTQIFTSTDGIVWEPVANTTLFSQSANRIFWNGSLFIVSGASADANLYDYATSPDGFNWTLRHSPIGSLNGTGKAGFLPTTDLALKHLL